MVFHPLHQGRKHVLDRLHCGNTIRLPNYLFAICIPSSNIRGELRLPKKASSIQIWISFDAQVPSWYKRRWWTETNAARAFPMRLIASAALTEGSNLARIPTLSK